MRRRIAAAALLTGVLVLAAPLAASAHVHVEPDRARAGAATDLTFTVPNESDSATTTKVAIAVPSGFGRVTAESVPGWTQRIVPSGGGSAVTFTATGAGVGKGATQGFVLRVGTVPDTGSVRLPAVQTYSDGTVVRWTQAPPASGEEPEHPAPTLYVRDAPPPDEDADGATTASAPAPADPLPLGLAAAALVVAVAALVVALVGLLRRR